MSCLTYAYMCVCMFFLKWDTTVWVFYFNKTFFERFYLFIWERVRKRDSEQGGRVEGEAESTLSREPDVGLHPRTLGLWPEPKGAAW